tara:strand:+ start:185 stop:400 length:216 start_codon:yes stop_codon:yes gene_type:complete
MDTGPERIFVCNISSVTLRAWLIGAFHRTIIPTTMSLNWRYSQNARRDNRCTHATSEFNHENPTLYCKIAI